MSTFKLTYATMFNPPEEMHQKYEQGLQKVKSNLGKEYAMLINGKDVSASEKIEDRSPVNTDWVLAIMQKGNQEHARQAVQAAHKAFPSWSRTPWQKRVELLRKVAGLIEERIFELAPALSLEVGKNRLEALGDIQEAIDLIYYNCDQMEKTMVLSSKWERILWLVMKPKTSLC
jgi:1-pyrroline-5-carboxylate dehydrogenase